LGHSADVDGRALELPKPLNVTVLFEAGHDLDERLRAVQFP
jgi:hypothetical protein